MLEIESIDAYYGELQALFDVSLYIDEGEVVALVGANGAGKTTLLNTISAILKPTNGQILFGGQNIGDLSIHELPKLGIVQVPEGRRLFPYLSVRDNLLLGGYNTRARTKHEMNLNYVFNLLPRLKDREKQNAGSLSGGEQQMLAIGRALMAMPRLLMLDEPSLGLAPLIVKEVFMLLERIRQEGVTVLLVEQNVKQALMLCDRGYVLQGGKIVLHGKGNDLLERSDLKSQLLGISET